MFTKEQMLDKVIKVRGFEDEWTLWFAKVLETETCLINLMTIMETVIEMP